MQDQFRKAQVDDIPAIWTILEGAIARRKADGSNQWQDGYPNQEVVTRDIEKEYGYVLLDNNEIVGYSAIMINDEPAYKDIIGAWLTDGDFVVYHRVAISENHLGKGLAKKMMASIEDFARENNINSIKVDTNFDNLAMLSILEKAGYQYCGEVVFRGSPRKAFEKVLG